MARSRRKYDSRSVNKQPSKTTTQDGVTDSSNAEVLPSKKHTRRKLVLKPLKKRLTKKERKQLEKIVSKKQKKAVRKELLENLSKVQAKSSELAMFDSVAHLGTKNSRLTALSKRPISEELQTAINDSADTTIAALKGWTGRRKRRRLEKKEKPVKVIEDFTSSSDEASSSDDEEEESEEEEMTGVDEKDETTEETSDKKVVDAEKESEKPTIVPNVETIRTSGQTENVENCKRASKPAVYVHLDRDENVQKARLSLPILAEEQVIMEAISENPVAIVCGQTGSGKTTQVPQFLYEAGYAKDGLIGITEPRRVAAVSMSKRVAMEMNLPTSKVSYQIRYENNVTDETCLKFMTDGVLARELKEDFLLSKYSVIILDEAHERTSNTDVLIGLLSRIVPLRNKKGKPLKLIIMSATLRVQDFTENRRLFKFPPPVVQVDSRQYSVTIHFNKRTPVSEDIHKCPYLNEAYKKICKIHRTLPAGGILVFVTGRQEVNALKKKLNSIFPSKPVAKANREESETKKQTFGQVDLDQYSAEPCSDEEDADEDDEALRRIRNVLDENVEDDGSDDDIFMEDAAFSTEVDNSLPLHVLPLYSLLSSDKQRLVFGPVPEGCRLCVVATNVAETSLTIPGIKYVVDTGKVKKKLYDKVTGVSAFRVTWTSKASANQRAGRAGRTESGHAYRLYSSAVFQDFSEFDQPEIVSKPVAGLVLQMKSMKIDRVINFPFPSPPPHESLESAERLLLSLGALQVMPCAGSLKEMKKAQFSGVITPLGQLISLFPVHPRFGKMIAEAIGHGHDVMSYVIAIVAALTVQEIFFTPTHDPDRCMNKEQARQMGARLKHLKLLWNSVGGGPERKLFGDLMVLLGAIGSAEYSDSTAGFCATNCLRLKAIFEVRKLRHQLTNVLKCVLEDVDLCLDPKMSPPSDEQVRLLRQIILSAMGDHVARKIPSAEIAEENKKSMKGAYKSLLIDEAVYIHPDSVMSRDPLPEFVVFQEISETDKGKRSYMRNIICIEPEWLAKHCPRFCNFTKPLDEPPPRYDVTSDDVMCHVTAQYGRLSWPIGVVEISYPSGADRYRWFARFLLEGEVIPSLKEFASSLLVRPATMVKSWAKLQPKTEVFLRTLQSREVDNKAKLLETWKENPQYLRSAYMDWLPQSLQCKLLSWPPI